MIPFELHKANESRISRPKTAESNAGGSLNREAQPAAGSVCLFTLSCCSSYLNKWCAQCKSFTKQRQSKI